MTTRLLSITDAFAHKSAHYRIVAATLALPPLLDVELPQASMLAVAVALAGCNLGTLAWYASRPDPPGAWGLFVQLLVDLAGWGTFLYLSGGASNPLNSFFLPLVAIGAAILPALQAELGRAPLGARDGGMGIGLFLAHAALARVGGSLSLLPRTGGGTIARLCAPLERIRA